MKKTTKKPIIIAFVNNKGGSGKTTCCSNIGSSLSIDGKKTLLIDGDMQINLTISFFDEEQSAVFSSSGKNLFQAVVSRGSLDDCIVSTRYKGLDMIPSSYSLDKTFAEAVSDKDTVLSDIFARSEKIKEYDYVLIDCPPTLDGWVKNVLVASDYALIPVEASPWGLFGLANMVEFCNNAKHDMKILGIAVTKADERKKYFKQTMQTLKELEDITLFENFIHTDSAVEWSQDNSEPVVFFKKSSRSALEYKKLAKEIVYYADR